MNDYDYTKPRGPIAAMYSSPGPCYGLPGLIGQLEHDPRSIHYKSAAYSFGLKHAKYSDDCSPGPAFGPMHKMYRDGRDGTPSVSMSFRPKTAPLPKLPGPSSYAPEKCGQQTYYRVPAYSMRQRTGLRREDKTPGPNAYEADSMMGRTVRAGKRQAPAYTMCGKQYLGSFYEDRAKTPGPNQYKTTHLHVYKSTPSAYTVTGRNYPPGESVKRPGPADYATDSVYVTKRRAPKFSFGIRHSMFEAPLILHVKD